MKRDKKIRKIKVSGGDVSDDHERETNSDIMNPDFSFQDHDIPFISANIISAINCTSNGKPTLDDLICKKRNQLVFSKYDENDFIKEIMTEEQDDIVHSQIVSDNISFHELNLSRPIQRALTQMGFVSPTKIQSATIPIALSGKDLCGGATTGSGKTAAFVIPILERLLFRQRQHPMIRVLILLPTRELAVQCHQVVTQLSQFTDISSCLLVGGLEYKQQEASLKARPDILVATPGRLIDHLKNTLSFTLDHIEILVLDEADRMLEIGFQEEIEEITRSCSKQRQTMLFSATLTTKIEDLIKLSMNNSPEHIFVDSNEAIAFNLIQEFIRVRSDHEEDRDSLMLALCQHYYKERCIIFFPTKIEAHRMRIIFGLVGLKATELHGNLTQPERIHALEQFKQGQVDFLIATDIAARGLDISSVQTVINYSMPSDYKQYLHRVGRTARAGRSGRSVSLVGEQDRKVLKMAIKNSKNVVRQRILPISLIDICNKNIKSMINTLNEISEEEKQDRVLQLNERKITKAQNMIKYGKEISNRPKRTFIKKIKKKYEK